MKITKIKLADLKKPERNVRRHTEKQMVEYVRSLDMFGQIRPLVVDENYVIIAGNGLYDALLKKGADTADCYVVTGLTDKEKKKLMLADNKIFELGYDDTDAFDAILKELEGDVDIPGWDEDLLKMLNATMGYSRRKTYRTFRRGRTGNRKLPKAVLMNPHRRRNRTMRPQMGLSRPMLLRIRSRRGRRRAGM